MQVRPLITALRNSTSKHIGTLPNHLNLLPQNNGMFPAINHSLRKTASSRFFSSQTPPLTPDTKAASRALADEFWNERWPTFSEHEKIQFSLNELYPEKYPKIENRVLWYKGIALEEFERFGEAVDVFHKLLNKTSDPKEKLKLHEKLLQNYKRLGQLDDVYHTAKNIHLLKIKIGDTYYQQGKLKEALEICGLS